ncbi:hypothetical protein NFI96_024153, partial [Prochilodus magdalenae]
HKLQDSIRASPTRKVGLSPYEIITGRPMSLPGTIDLRQADVHITSDALLKYCEELTDSMQQYYARDGKHGPMLLIAKWMCRRKAHHKVHSQFVLDLCSVNPGWKEYIYSTGRFCWVFGMLEVKGASRLPILKIVRDRSRNTLMPLIRKHIRTVYSVYSDCWRAYEPALNVTDTFLLITGIILLIRLLVVTLSTLNGPGKPSSPRFHVTEATRPPNFLKINSGSFSGTMVGCFAGINPVPGLKISAKKLAGLWKRRSTP